MPALWSRRRLVLSRLLKKAAVVAVAVEIRVAADLEAAADPVAPAAILETMTPAVEAAADAAMIIQGAEAMVIPVAAVAATAPVSVAATMAASGVSCMKTGARNGLAGVRPARKQPGKQSATDRRFLSAQLWLWSARPYPVTCLKRTCAAPMMVAGNMRYWF
ncbi:MAG: hypothetical protein ACRCXM_11880 [Beijerinckiaceae bacterium]